MMLANSDIMDKNGNDHSQQFQNGWPMIANGAGEQLHSATNDNLAADGGDHGSFSSKRLYATNLPFRFRDTDLIMLFDKYGPVLEAEIVFNDRGSKGYGFVTMKSNVDAEVARQSLNGTTVEGRRIVVKDATERCYQPKPKSKNNKAVETSVSNMMIGNVYQRLAPANPMIDLTLAQNALYPGLTPNAAQSPLQIMAALQAQQQLLAATQLAMLQNVSALQNSHLLQNPASLQNSSVLQNASALLNASGLIPPASLSANVAAMNALLGEQSRMQLNAAAAQSNGAQSGLGSIAANMSANGQWNMGMQPPALSNSFASGYEQSNAPFVNSQSIESSNLSLANANVHGNAAAARRALMAVGPSASSLVVGDKVRRQDPSSAGRGDTRFDSTMRKRRCNSSSSDHNSNKYSRFY